ncbi:hypothetical protein KUTeg_000420 [Tegillarca granosa]|uniref:Neurotransmitter-gated ion-channel ligand-binding domain-containing protein n=1 Tax=Tegillarca granosa TaxID=220873 RepID=A0ABQ9FXJ4_TEGGR|nr:hypothetical protein KUTeg_000420 [Tegillarca granosa]
MVQPDVVISQVVRIHRLPDSIHVGILKQKRCKRQFSLHFVDNVPTLADKDIPIIANSAGFMVWSFGMSLTTNCYCDVTFYPFDKQTCELGFIIVGAHFTDVQLSLSPYNDPLQTSYFRPNGEWEFVGNLTKIEETVVDGFVSRSVLFFIEFRRRPLFHFINSLLPVTLFSSLSCASFRVPADSGEKIGFCLTVLLGFAVYLTILTDFIPNI